MFSMQRISRAKLIAEPIIRMGLTRLHSIPSLYQTLCKIVDALDGIETAPAEASPGKESSQRRERRVNIGMLRYL